MKYRILTVFVLLAASIAVPLFMSSFVSVSTSKKDYGSPTFLRVEYDYDGRTTFSKATVFSEAVIFYSGISASLAFLAGGVFARPRETRNARVIFWIVFLAAAIFFSFGFILH